jgi:phosphatidylglycerol:prolipoprotein diacylglycerol transferase
VLAYFEHSFSPFIFQIGGWGPRWYGAAYVVAFVIGFMLFRHLARRGLAPLSEDRVEEFITVIAFFGVLLGGRLGWVIFYGWDRVVDDPWIALKLWEGGMASHGGIIGVAIASFVYSRLKRLSWTGLGDALCAVAPVGIILGRIANFINGELVGKVAVGVPWAVIFPTHDALPRHPSQLYAAFLEGIVLFLIAWLLRTRAAVPRGVISGAFFISYGVLRIISEIWREPDSAWHLGMFSAGQALSFGLPLVGVAFIVWGYRTQEFESGVKQAA